MKNQLKRMLAMLMAVALLIGCMSFTGFAAYSKGLEFELNAAGDGYIVTDKGSWNKSRLVIPATYNGLPVTEIGADAFLYCPNLTSVTMPSVITIDHDAFGFCKKLTSVTVSDIRSIGKDAFDYGVIKTVYYTEGSDVDAIKTAFDIVGGDIEYLPAPIIEYVTNLDMSTDDINTGLSATLPEDTYYTQYMPDSDPDAEDDEDYVTTYVDVANGIDIDLYLWKDVDMQNVFSFATGEAGESEVFGKLINGVPAAYYYANEEDNGKHYATLSIVYDDGENLVQLVFWLYEVDAAWTADSIDESNADVVAAWEIANSVATADENDKVTAAEKKRLGDTCFYFDPTKNLLQMPLYEGSERFYGNDEDSDYQVGYYYSLDMDLDFDVYAWTENEGVTLNEVITEEIAKEEANGGTVTFVFSDEEEREIKEEFAEAMGLSFDFSFTYYITVYGDGEDADVTVTFVAQNGNQFSEMVLYIADDNAVYYFLPCLSFAHDFENDVCKNCGVPAPSDNFVTKLNFKKDYDNSYEAGQKSEVVKETVTFAVTPITDNAPAFSAETYSFNVENGVAEISIPLPETVTAAGEYWYKLQEAEGETAGVTYNTDEYYIHMVTAKKNDAFGVAYVTVHKTAPEEDGSYTNDSTDKTDTITNSYAEGEITIEQVTSGNAANPDDEFTVTVTLDKGDKEITGNITVGTTEYAPADWDEDGTLEITLTLKNGESATISGVPDGVTYTVEQTVTSDGYSAPAYTLSENEDPDATDGSTNATGSVADKLDVVTITNEKNIPIDVGVIMENGTYIGMALAVLTVGAFLVLSRKKKYEGE